MKELSVKVSEKRREREQDTEKSHNEQNMRAASSLGDTFSLSLSLSPFIQFIFQWMNLP